MSEETEVVTSNGDVVVPSVQNLINTAVGEKPDDFAAAFNDLMRAKLADAVDAKKVGMSQTLFGVPEIGDTDVDDAVAHAHAETDEVVADEDDEAGDGEPEATEDGTENGDQGTD